MRALTSSEYLKIHGGVTIAPLTLLKENIIKPAVYGAIAAIGIGFVLGYKNLGRLAVIYGCASVVSYNTYCIGTFLFPK